MTEQMFTMGSYVYRTMHCIFL